MQLKLPFFAWRPLPASLCCLAPAVSGAAQQVHQFEVLLDGKPMGTHDFHVSRAVDGAREVRSEARFDVRMLALTLYRYRHTAREQWNAGRLRRIDAGTRDGGEQIVVQGELRNGRFELGPSGGARKRLAVPEQLSLLGSGAAAGVARAAQSPDRRDRYGAV